MRSSCRPRELEIPCARKTVEHIPLGHLAPEHTIYSMWMVPGAPRPWPHAGSGKNILVCPWILGSRPMRIEVWVRWWRRAVLSLPGCLTCWFWWGQEDGLWFQVPLGLNHSFATHQPWLWPKYLNSPYLVSPHVQWSSLYRSCYD